MVTRGGWLRLGLGGLCLAVTIGALSPAPAGAALGRVPAGPALAAAVDDNCAQPGLPVGPVPWAQQLFGPDRIWPITRGQGIVVAVLDSGVDANQPQLRGAVLPGVDATAGGPANTDCLGTGTQVAGVIAGRPTDSAGFAGLAPAVTILPIRVINGLTNSLPVADPAVLAGGINAAVDNHADVIVVSAVAYSPSDALAAAITRAATAGILTVAAVGDLGDATAPNLTPYPAAYPGVVGVGAVDVNGVRWAKSGRGSFVAVVAPGANVLTLQRGSGLTVVSGTGVAAGFGGATLALARAKRGRAVPASTLRRVLGSTSMSRGGGPGYGQGLIDPYAAVNDQLAASGPAPLPPLVRPDAALGAGVRSRNIALIGALIIGVAVVSVLLVALAIPRGRRRRWRATLARTPEPVVEPAEPGPPVLLFDDPS